MQQGSADALNSRKLLVVAFTAAFVVLLAASCYHLYNSPVVGASFSWDDAGGHYKVTSAKPWSKLKPGDAIRKIGDLDIEFEHLLKDNIYIDSRAELFSWFKAKEAVFQRLEAPSVIFLVVREGKETAVAVTPKKAGISFLNNLVFLHFVAGMIFFLLGVIVFYRKEPGEQRFAFVAMSLSLMLVFITNATSLMCEVGYRPAYLRLMNIVNIIALPLGNAILFHVSLLLPHKRAFLHRFPWLLPLFYGVCIAVIASFSIPVINFLTALLATLTFISVVHAFFADRRPLERQQMKWVLAGFICGLSPWVFINAIPMLITGQRITDDTLSAAFVVFIPLSMAFAIWKYRLMDIDAFLEGTLTYVVTILLVGIADIAFLGLLDTYFTGAQLINNALVSGIFVLSLYVLLRERMGAFLRRVFKRVTPSEADMILRFNSKAHGLPPDGIIQAFVDVVNDAFQPKRSTVIRKDDPDAEVVFQCFRDRCGIVTLWDVPGFDNLLSRQFYVAVVITREEQIEAVLLLGGTSRRGLYTRRDLAALNALFIQARALHENAILYERNVFESNERLAEERRHINEKEMLLKELHDGIGGIASNIHLLAEMACDSSSLTDTKKALSTISGLAKEGLSEIGSFLLSLDPLEATYDVLITEIHHSGRTILAPHNIDFSFERSINGANGRPERLFFLNILRICKEAFTNIVKHARASTVKVKLGCNDGLFILSIQDDGIGLLQAKSGGRGLANMKARALDIGGRLFVSSGKGTCIHLEVPVSSPEPGETGEQDRTGVNR